MFNNLYGTLKFNLSSEIIVSIPVIFRKRKLVLPFRRAKTGIANEQRR